MSLAWRRISTLVVVCVGVGIGSSVGYYWPDVTQRLERMGIAGWRLWLARSLLVVGTGVLCGLLIRWLWHSREQGAQNN